MPPYCSLIQICMMNNFSSQGCKKAYMKTQIITCTTLKNVYILGLLWICSMDQMVPLWQTLELGPYFIHLFMPHGDSHGTCGVTFCSVKDQWQQQITFNMSYTQATANYVKDTQINKIFSLLLRKFIAIVFPKKMPYNLHKLHYLPPISMPVKSSFWFSMGFV